MLANRRKAVTNSHFVHDEVAPHAERVVGIPRHYDELLQKPYLSFSSFARVLRTPALVTFCVSVCYIVVVGLSVL